MDLSYQFSPNDKLNGICHRGTEVTENPAFEFLYDLYDLCDLCDLCGKNGLLSNLNSYTTHYFFSNPTCDRKSRNSSRRESMYLRNCAPSRKFSSKLLFAE